MRARIGRPASMRKHWSPPPMRLDLPPARRMPATGSLALMGLEAGGRHVETGLGARLFRAVRALDPDRAIFVFGDLADRIELRIGEDVGRRLDISEGDEERALLDGEIGAGGELDRAPSRRHPDGIAGLDPGAGPRPR